MKQVHKEGSLEFYEYTPSPLKPFHINLEPLTFKRRVRLFFAYFSGFKVIYLKENNDFVGYCLVQSGKDRRYQFATENDIMVGPYFIHEDYRGRKLSITLLEYVLKKSNLQYENAYDYIQRDNIPSIKASEAVGFKYYSDANLSQYLRSLSLCPPNKGDYLILRYVNK